MPNDCFWYALDTLVESSEIVIDRPKNSQHPRYPDKLYPLDYGYLQGTRSGDGDGIDVWLGSLAEKKPTAIVLSIDLAKRDSELKILLGCTHEEMDMIVTLHNIGKQSALLVKR